MGAIAGHKSTVSEVSDENRVKELIDKHEVRTVPQFMDGDSGESKVRLHGDVGFVANRGPEYERGFLSELGEECLREPLMVRSYHIPGDDSLPSFVQWAAYPNGEVEREDFSHPDERTEDEGDSEKD